MGIAPVNATATVTTAGTRVQVNSSSVLVISLYVEALKTNTGVIYLGLSDVSATKYIAALSPGQAFGISTDARGRLGGEAQLNVYYLDSSVSGEKAQVTYLQRTGSY
jgi:hypothetical protein